MLKHVALLLLLFAAMSAEAKVRAAGRGGRVDEVIRGFQRISATVPFTTPSFWAWELQLAIAKGDEELARGLARVLYGLQEPDGSWPLGTDWVRAEWDFKHRLADDSESWEVAEVANALLDYAKAFGDAEAVVRAARAAEYLKNAVEYVDGKPYLPHMPECNHILQAHSTVNAAFLLSRIAGYEALGQELKAAGVSMNFQRIITYRNLEKLEPPLVGMEINDYEKIQIGWYLLQMGDPYGQMILDRYREMKDINSPRGAVYLVLVYTRLGDPARARHFATLQKGFRPTNRGYDYALRDFIDYALR
ncbi:MAG TPA: hypothetical protein VEK57_22220 [Thermoanaerobaculia bacterium]|nr:hypothetical protein [Thermoanaerobaculia bacterium]